MRQLAAGTRPTQSWTGTGSRPLAAAVARQRSSRWQASNSHTRLAAAADASAYVTDPVLSHAVPYLSKSAPKLQSRRMMGSPADGLWSAVTGALMRLELFSAATVDKHTKIGPAVMSVIAAASVAMGLDGFTLLQRGLPPYFQDLLFSAFGVWDTTLWTLGLAAVAVPVTAWALRAWWVSSILLLSAPGGAVQQLQQLAASLQQHQQQDVTAEQQVPEQQSESSRSWWAALLTAVRGGCLTAVGSASSVLTSSSGWLAALLAVGRGICLMSAVSSISSIMASSSTTVMVSCGSAAAIAAAVAAAPVALLPLREQPPSAAASLLAVEAAYVPALVGLAPTVNAVAAAVMAAGVCNLHQQLVAPRLLACKASEGDQMEVHVSLRVAGTEAVFDSTYTADPLKLVAAKVDPEFKQAWAQLSSDKLWDQNLGDDGGDQQNKEQQDASPKAGDSSSSSRASEEASRGDGKPFEHLRTVFQTQQSWMTNPEARWEAVQPFAAEAACGMVLGETRSVVFFNPKGVGYWNPRFSWWQPLSDVDDKFKGQTPDPGDVFWYPVADGAYVQTRVTSVGDTYVELDANYGVTGTDLCMDVQLVRLQKQ